MFFLEILESREFLSGDPNDVVRTIRGGNDASNHLLVYLKQDGIHFNTNGAEHLMAWPRGLDELRVFAGKYPYGLTTAKNTYGRHEIIIKADAGVASKLDLVKVLGTQKSWNIIRVFTNRVSVSVFGGKYSSNTLVVHASGSGRVMRLTGGDWSTNRLGTKAGNTFLIGGSHSRNFLSSGNDDAYFRGGVRSFNTFFIDSGNNTVIGGKRSRNDFFLKSQSGSGTIRGGIESRNTLYTLNGQRPAGYAIFGTVRIRHA